MKYQLQRVSSSLKTFNFQKIIIGLFKFISFVIITIMQSIIMVAKGVISIIKKPKSIKHIHHTISNAFRHKTLNSITATIIILLLLFVKCSGGYDYDGDEYDYYDNGPIKVVIPEGINLSESPDYGVVEYRVKSGDNLATILNNVGSNSQNTYEILEKLKKLYNLRDLQVGQKISIKYLIKTEPKEEGGSETKDVVIVDELRLNISPEEEAVVTLQDDGTYSAKKNEMKLKKYLMKYEGTIENSLFLDGMTIGAPANIMMNMVLLYGFDVDFQRDIRKGNKFEVLFESYYNQNGEKVRDGNILFSSLHLDSRDVNMYYHVMENGKKEYFNELGQSVRKSLMRTPINGARISSSYGMRMHPILGYSKKHEGIDFAARTGTPFFAAGDGVITKIGRNGGFGNYIQIKHNKDYSTEYAHISKYARGMKNGTRVKQGQIIAYVGSTGRSTGPHLHYGVLYKGSRINPRTVKPLANIKLAGNQLENFNKDKGIIDQYLKNTPNQNRLL